ncbi:hypothetical protein [Flavitalea sp.]|nr:hypothetical protein [Flavitalea sp.]
MGQRNMLVNFEFKSYHLLGVRNNQRLKSRRQSELPLLQVQIDFAAGKMAVQADMKCIIHFSRHIENQYLFAYKKRLQMQMNILSPGAVDLDEVSCDGLVFPLEGEISDESIWNNCTGKLVLKNTWVNNDSNRWNLGFYFYDQSTDCGEIKFDLPIYLVNGYEVN